MLAARSATYLQLPLPPDAVHFVDSAAGLAQVASLLEEAAVLGLDCEWEPCTESRRGSDRHPPVSLLQVTQTILQ